MSDDTKHNRTARRLWLVAIVVLAWALAYGLGRFGGFGWLDRSVAPEPATVRIETPKATPMAPATSAPTEDSIDTVERAQIAVDAQLAALDEAERPVADALEVVIEAEARIAELETELLTAQASRPDDLDELRRLGEELERWRLIAVEAVDEAESQRQQATAILSDLQAAVDREAEMMVVAEQEARRRAEQEARRRAEEEVRVHPEVQAQGEALALEVVEKHRVAWPWVQSAWDWADVVFFDGRLPERCAGAWACAVDRRTLWFTLDSVRDATDREHAVLHELGHVAAGLPAWSGLLEGFSDHFVGCYSRGAEAEDLPEELMVDAVVQAMRLGDPSAGYGYYAGGAFQDGSFSGCLAEAELPPDHLVDLIWQTLFDCSSGRAQDALWVPETPSWSLSCQDGG